MLLTHAHLDHCGLIPHVVKDGYSGPIYATAGTIELAALVLLDSGKLQEEFAKREMRWERRHPDQAVADDAAEREDYLAAVDLAASGERLADSANSADAPVLADSPALAPPGDIDRASTCRRRSSRPRPLPHRRRSAAEHIAHAQPPDPNSIPTRRCTPSATPAPRCASFRPVEYDTEIEVAPGIHARFLDAGHILGSAIIVIRVEGDNGEPERTIVFSGDLGRPGAPILRDYTAVTEADYVLVETTYGGREHEPQAEAQRVLAETVQTRRPKPGRAAGAVVRHRPDAGARLRAGSADRQRRDPAAAALSRLAHGLEGDRHLPPPHRVLRRGGRRPAARPGHAAGLPEPGRDQRRQGLAGRSPALRGRT